MRVLAILLLAAVCCWLLYDRYDKSTAFEQLQVQVKAMEEERASLRDSLARADAQLGIKAPQAWFQQRLLERPPLEHVSDHTVSTPARYYDSGTASRTTH